jgi:hypothetical protein
MIILYQIKIIILLIKINQINVMLHFLYILILFNFNNYYFNTSIQLWKINILEKNAHFNIVDKLIGFPSFVNIAKNM